MSWALGWEADWPRSLSLTSRLWWFSMDKNPQMSAAGSASLNLMRAEGRSTFSQVSESCSSCSHSSHSQQPELAFNWTVKHLPLGMWLDPGSMGHQLPGLSLLLRTQWFSLSLLPSFSGGPRCTCWEAPEGDPFPSSTRSQ